VQQEPVPPLVPAEQIPPQLHAVIARMLAKDARERPGSMREVIDDLEAALNDTLTFDFDEEGPSEETNVTRQLEELPGPRPLPEPPSPPRAAASPAPVGTAAPAAPVVLQPALRRPPTWLHRSLTLTFQRRRCYPMRAPSKGLRRR
jgi:hypothetical protein